MPSPSQTQSHLRYPLTGLLGSAGSVRVLRALTADAAPQSAPQLAAAAGLTAQGARLVLDGLVRQRLVSALGSGRAQLYALNAAHPLAAALHSLFEAEHHRWLAVLGAIRAVLEGQGAAVSAAWLYGSVARGDDSHGSDVDLAIVVRAQSVADRVREELSAIEDEQFIRISLAALTPKDLSALPEGDPWWTNVAREARVLKGPAPDQARRRLARAA
jgi:predicted nucleotidyltransferase